MPVVPGSAAQDDAVQLAQRGERHSFVRQRLVHRLGALAAALWIDPTLSLLAPNSVHKALPELFVKDGPCRICCPVARRRI